ncbi:hypothetical protein HPS54_01765 [Prevotella sp. PCHR]|uniref:DHHW protein n=1 Tax=Xylanibacter caecicola TaxID=2736294 RepID=A0ABX2AYD1_9BACT|nr:DHHW family protein [Xylanibacter caecicola]NPE24256.1 hypothetical protein [Xylanibacter caecicola]
MTRNKIYILLIAAVFITFTVVFDTFPRSTYSELEKRELASFPEFSFEKLFDGSFTRDVSSWFSDSEPFRDDLMSCSMQIKDMIRLTMSEDNVTFHASADAPAAVQETETDKDAIANRNVDEYHNELTANENAKIANAGIIVVGTGDKVRALMAYGGGSKGGVSYAGAANKYKETFGNKVNVYCMVIPTAAEYYCPEKARKCTNSQQATINNIHAHLRPDVKAVDIYTILGEHAAEDIYLRTDHHWAPLGAYYAAYKFAKVAGVPFKDLKHYDRKVVRNYVGSMYGYSKDASLKNAPEDFVYYVPRGVQYTTTYINYTINSHYQVTGEQKPQKSIYFFKYRDGHSGAYCTFMGGDTKITQVRTSTKNGRRVMILKDSFGNAIPGYLFFSFEEIHVVDARYFTKNMVDYVRENKITDILFANNIFNAYSGAVCKKYVHYLTQRHGAMAPKDEVKDEHTHAAHERKDTVAHHAIHKKPEPAVDNVSEEAEKKEEK